MLAGDKTTLAELQFDAARYSEQTRQTRKFCGCCLLTIQPQGLHISMHQHHQYLQASYWLHLLRCPPSALPGLRPWPHRPGGLRPDTRLLSLLVVMSHQHHHHDCQWTPPPSSQHHYGQQCGVPLAVPRLWSKLMMMAT